MPFFEWLRRNSERYLLEAAQAEMAHRYLDRPRPRYQWSLGRAFWRYVFTPIYRRLPWRLRRSIIIAMPGSHRRRWQGRGPPSGKRASARNALTRSGEEAS